MTNEQDHDFEHDVTSASHEPAPQVAEQAPGHLSRSASLRRPARAEPSALVSRAARDDNGVADGAEHAVADAAASASGQALPANLMRKFEDSLGADLSGVRVHTGEASAAANDAVGARAYTVGNDIHFGDGEYDPSTAEGEHLLAHEVAHTVQQAGGGEQQQFKLAVSTPGDAHEVEADRAADAMVMASPFAVESSGGSLERSTLRRDAKSGGAPAKVKLIQKTLPLELPLIDARVSFVKLSLKLAGEFKGSAGVKGSSDKQESSADTAGLANDLASYLKTGGPPGSPGLSFDPGGWIGIKEMTLANVGVGKGSLGKLTLFKGKVYRGKTQVGEVSVSVSALNWDATKGEPTVGLFPVEVVGEVIAASFDAEQVLPGGSVVGAGSKVSGGLKGQASIDLASIAKMAGGELAVASGELALAPALGTIGLGLLAGAGMAVTTIAVTETLDELDSEAVIQDAYVEADRTALGFDQEMMDPGHSFKPSPFWKKDPYAKGVEMASQLKTDFFAKFLADPSVAKWCSAHPDKGEQNQQLDAAYRSWIKTDDGAKGVVSMHSQRLKFNSKQRTFEEKFLAYANRWRIGSGAARVLKVFDQLWPNATWMDSARTMPVFFRASVPRSCYQVVSEIAPATYPADLSKWVEPPTLT